jgi:hypothetical protein
MMFVVVNCLELHTEVVPESSHTWLDRSDPLWSRVKLDVDWKSELGVWSVTSTIKIQTQIQTVCAQTCQSRYLDIYTQPETGTLATCDWRLSTMQFISQYISRPSLSSFVLTHSLICPRLALFKSPTSSSCCSYSTAFIACDRACM